MSECETTDAESSSINLGSNEGGSEVEPSIIMKLLENNGDSEESEEVCVQKKRVYKPKPTPEKKPVSEARLNALAKARAVRTAKAEERKKKEKELKDLKKMKLVKQTEAKTVRKLKREAKEAKIKRERDKLLKDLDLDYTYEYSEEETKPKRRGETKPNRKQVTYERTQSESQIQPSPINHLLRQMF